MSLTQKLGKRGRFAKVSNCTHDDLGSSDAGQSEHIYDNRYIPGLNSRFRRKNDEEITLKNPVSRSLKGGRGKPEIQQMQLYAIA